MHREVNLTKQVRTRTGLRYCPVVLSQTVELSALTSSG